MSERAQALEAIGVLVEMLIWNEPARRVSRSFSQFPSPGELLALDAIAAILRGLASAEGVSPQPADNGYTLRSLSNYFGWGLADDDRAIWRFAVARENTLRLAQDLLETGKSHAATAEDAIRERVEQLKSPAPVSPVEPTPEPPQDGGNPK